MLVVGLVELLRNGATAPMGPGTEPRADELIERGGSADEVVLIIDELR